MIRIPITPLSLLGLLCSQRSRAEEVLRGELCARLRHHDSQPAFSVQGDCGVALFHSLHQIYSGKCCSVYRSAATRLHKALWSTRYYFVHQSEVPWFGGCVFMPFQPGRGTTGHTDCVVIYYGAPRKESHQSFHVGAMRRSTIPPQCI